MNEDKSKAAFITFYSFKGGVGRSMALINTAGILAGRGFRVLVMDLDLEAPGLSYLNPDGPDASSQQDSLKLDLQSGFVDLLSDAKARGKDGDLFALPVEELKRKYTKPYNLPEEIRDSQDGSLHIMPAGKFDANYATRFNDLNLRELYEDGLGEPLIRAFKKKFAEAGIFDYVLVDSRTGFSDEAGICTRDLADHLMILSGLNRQNVSGTSGFLRALRLASKGSRLSFDIILSPVPNGEDKLVDERETEAKSSFEKAWGAPIEIQLQIPYHPQLALTEEPHIFRRHRGYLFEAYRKIERSMLRSLGHDAFSMMKQIEGLLNGKEYLAALDILRHVIKFDGGKGSLSRLISKLAYREKSSANENAGVEITQEEATLDQLLKEENGRSLLEFVIDNLPLGTGDWATDSFLQQLKGKSIDLADRLYKRRITTAPKDADILCEYAIFLDLQRGDANSAEGYFQEALAATPKDARILGNYAIFLEKRGDLDKAETYYQQALATAPKHAEVLGSYADFLHKRGDMVGAERYYKQALASHPEDARVLGNYAVFLESHGDVVGAETYYQQALAAEPKYAAVVANFADFLDKRGDVAGAKTYYQRALALNPKHASVLGVYATFLNKIGDATAAEACYQRALGVDSKNADLLGNYAIFLEKRGDLAKAETYYQRALEANPKHADNLGNYAVFLKERGDLVGAEKYYQRALEADPKHASNLGLYANFLEKRGDLAGAEKYYQRALEANPKHANNLCNYGQFLMGLNRLSVGRGTLLSAFKILNHSDFGNVAETCFSLWLVSRMLGQNAESWEAAFKFALKQGFERSPWNFERMLEQAGKTLQPEELDYAKAMASAYLDAGKVADLEKYERWRALEPLNPMELAKTVTA
jgi:Tfp pilus assembly protein PilF/cellulose biosynthesis protein BcsQ